MFAKIIASKDI